MPEIGPSGLEGGVALTRHPYPYLVRARPRAQKRDSALCLRPKKRPATIGRPQRFRMSF